MPKGPRTDLAWLTCRVVAGTSVHALLSEMVHMGARDLYVSSGFPPSYLVDGSMVDGTDPADPMRLVAELLDPDQVEAELVLLALRPPLGGDTTLKAVIDGPHGLIGQHHRFRLSCWRHATGLGLTFRHLPSDSSHLSF